MDRHRDENTKVLGQQVKIPLKANLNFTLHFNTKRTTLLTLCIMGKNSNLPHGFLQNHSSNGCVFTLRVYLLNESTFYHHFIDVPDLMHWQPFYTDE